MKDNPIDRVTFNKQQLAFLERTFGTLESLTKEITIEANLVMLNRKAGQQDVINTIRERTV